MGRDGTLRGDMGHRAGRHGTNGGDMGQVIVFYKILIVIV